MEKVISNVVFLDSEDTPVFAVMFVGVMDDTFIYAKRASIISCTPENDPTYIRIAVKDTKDTTSSWVSEWNGPFRDIDVQDDIGLDDPRIVVEPELSEEIREAIEEAFAEM